MDQTHKRKQMGNAKKCHMKSGRYGEELNISFCCGIRARILWLKMLDLNKSSFFMGMGWGRSLQIAAKCVLDVHKRLCEQNVKVQEGKLGCLSCMNL